jgi:carbonic anhydrase
MKSSAWLLLPAFFLGFAAAEPPRPSAAHSTPASPASAAQHAPAQHAPAPWTAEKALKRLMDGNLRFVKHRELHPDATILRRKDLAASGQHPFAIIVGCADSRVPPELIFDQGFGDMFVIRDAGNVVDDEVLGSIEYAVEHLGTPLIMVLGHEKCGAITAALEGVAAHGHIQSVVDSIQPAILAAKNEAGDPVHNCVVANARRVASQIRTSDPVLRPLAEAGKIRVVAADYDLNTGKVALLKD